VISFCHDFRDILRCHKVVAITRVSTKQLKKRFKKQLKTKNQTPKPKNIRLNVTFGKTCTSEEEYCT
jgi:hypothetical protein